MVEPQPPSNQRYEAKFGLAPGQARYQLWTRLRQRAAQLTMAGYAAHAAGDTKTGTLCVQASHEIGELWEALAPGDPEPYTWYMPLTPEEGTAIERELRRKI